MKKLFIILLLFVSVAGKAQMIVSDSVKRSSLGIEVTYRLYKADPPSDNYVIFLHGAGEKGPVDGTELYEVERHGYPKHAKNGFKFPFNIIAPQSAVDHRNLMKTFPAYVKLKYKAKVIIVTGLSLGGYGSYDAELYDKLCIVDAIAPVCGAGRPTLMSEYPSTMVAWHFHGDADQTVRWSTARAFITGYNSTHGGMPIKTTIYPGVGHNSWDRAYSVTPGQDELLQWMIEICNNAPQDKPPIDIEIVKQKILEALNELK
jgi:predicted peptidase